MVNVFLKKMTQQSYGLLRFYYMIRPAPFLYRFRLFFTFKGTPAIGLWFIFLAACCSPFTLLRAQESYKTIGKDELKSAQDALLSLGDSILKGSSDSLRIHSNSLFKDQLGRLLEYQNTFAENFDSLNSISVLRSRDGFLKIYTWILPAHDKSACLYFGFLQTLDKKSRQVRLFPLNEVKFENEEAVHKTCSADEWYGALYYKLIENKTKGQTLYTLLGWHGKGWKTTRKVVDILYFKKGNPVFGKPVIRVEGKPYCRLVYEFNAQAVMKLQYDDNLKMIIMDHLSPARGAEKGQYEFYGPDFSYDGLKFKNGTWQLKKDIDVRNPKSFNKREGKKEKGKVFYDAK